MSRNALRIARKSNSPSNSKGDATRSGIESLADEANADVRKKEEEGKAPSCQSCGEPADFYDNYNALCRKHARFTMRGAVW